MGDSSTATPSTVTACWSTLRQTPPTHRGHPQHHLLEAKRLAHEVVGTEGKAPLGVFTFLSRSQKDDRCGDSSLADSLEYLVSVGTGHVDVEQDQVDAFLAREANRLESVPGAEGLVPRQGEGIAEQEVNRLLVVDHQNSRHASGSLLDG